MSSWRLKLNMKKTECMLIGSNSRLFELLEFLSLTVEWSSLDFKSSVRNLDIWFDSPLSIKTQLNNLRKKIRFYLFSSKLDKSDIHVINHCFRYGVKFASNWLCETKTVEIQSYKYFGLFLQHNNRFTVICKISQIFKYYKT